MGNLIGGKPPNIKHDSINKKNGKDNVMESKQMA